MHMLQKSGDRAVSEEEVGKISPPPGGSTAPEIKGTQSPVLIGEHGDVDGAPDHGSRSDERDSLVIR